MRHTGTATHMHDQNNRIHHQPHYGVAQEARCKIQDTRCMFCNILHLVTLLVNSASCGMVDQDTRYKMQDAVTVTVTVILPPTGTATRNQDLGPHITGVSRVVCARCVTCVQAPSPALQWRRSCSAAHLPPRPSSASLRWTSAAAWLHPHAPLSLQHASPTRAPAALASPSPRPPASPLVSTALTREATSARPEGFRRR